VRGKRWDPRSLDLDLLLMDDHRLRERSFVLVPLAEP
jgi:7,8-dihydro-6-hydroxymethylpterin-pyrophosphokinase